MITELERRLMDAFHEDAQRARLVHSDASWDDREDRSHLQLGANRLDPDEQLVPVKEIYVSVDSPPTSETRNRRRLAMAAVAVVAVIGVAAIATNSPNSDDDVRPAPATAPTVAPTTVAPTTVAPRTETGSLDLENGLSVTFTVPDGWAWDTTSEQFFHLPRGSGKPKMEKVNFFDVSNVFADGCQRVPVDPPVGQTVDDFVSALANLVGFAPSAAADVTVDGYVGKQIEFNVPGECDTFALWRVGGGFSHSATSNQHIQLWILDVGGTRLVIEGYSYRSTPPQTRAEIDDIVATIQISQ
jgi:hypothetical protein